MRAYPREAHLFAEHSRPPSSNLPARYSQKERSSATLLFFRDLISEIFIFAEQIPLEQVVVDY